MDETTKKNDKGPPLFESTVDPEESTSTAVVRSVAAVSDMDPIELPPLYESVATDALDSVFFDRRSEGRVQFTYADYLISVSADGVVLVRESASSQ